MMVGRAGLEHSNPPNRFCRLVPRPLRLRLQIPKSHRCQGLELEARVGIELRTPTESVQVTDFKHRYER